jgi:hypothetical protein
MKSVVVEAVALLRAVVESLYNLSNASAAACEVSTIVLAVAEPDSAIARTVVFVAEVVVAPIASVVVAEVDVRAALAAVVAAADASIAALVAAEDASIDTLVASAVIEVREVIAVSIADSDSSLAILKADLNSVRLGLITVLAILSVKVE